GNESNVGATSAIASSNRQEPITVDAFPLDQLLTDDERRRLRLIKIDIEGAEPAVLRRFLQTLDLYGPRTCLIVEASPQIHRKAWSELFTAFKEAGFYA
ncbi:MAG: FkbM family methyltransferase, partial [Bradyrhizobium sp.]|nr:FkbM family methyltransferase [Bradyrhizobium sp.]